MATEVTPVSDLSSMTQALPSLSQADLRALQTNITVLLEPTDDDDDAKMESLPMLPEPDVADDFPLALKILLTLLTTHLQFFYHLHLLFSTFSLTFLFPLFVRVLLLHSLLPSLYRTYQQPTLPNQTTFQNPKHLGWSHLLPLLHLSLAPPTHTSHPWSPTICSQSSLMMTMPPTCSSLRYCLTMRLQPIRAPPLNNPLFSVPSPTLMKILHHTFLMRQHLASLLIIN